MNARRIHTLMRKHFPVITTVEHEWINLADAKGLCEAKLQELLNNFFDSPELMVEMHQCVGKSFPMVEGASFVAEQLGQGQIQIADRNFNGVATAWENPYTRWKATTLNSHKPCSLSNWPTRRQQAPLVGALRAPHSGAAYRRR